MNQYIPLPQAAKRLHVSPGLLTRMISDGTLFAVTTTEGQTLIPLDTVEKMAKEIALRDKIWNKVKRFEGENVGIREAREEFGLSPNTLYLCISKGYIRAGEGSKGGRGKTRRLNKADVLYVAELSKSNPPGRRLFTPDTIPPHAVA